MLCMIKETISNFEKELLDIKKKQKNSNEALNIDVYTERIIGDKTLEQVGNIHGVSRERVRQVESNLFDQIQKIFATIDDELNIIAEDLFKTNGLIFEISNVNIEELRKYEAIIKKYYLEDKNSNRIFNIDLKNNIVYKKTVNLQKLFNLIYEDLKDNELYNETSLIQIISNKRSITDEFRDIDCTKLLCTLFIRKSENFIKLDSNGNLLYSVEKLNKRKEVEKKFLYWFKTLYPYGVHLPQYNMKISNNNAKKVGEKFIEPLLAKVPELSKDYRTTLNRIVKSDEIVPYDNGHYIHKDYIVKICQDNKTFIELLSKEIYKLFNKDCNCIRVYSVFKSLENDFINIGIITHELLFYLFQTSEIEIFNYYQNRYLVQKGTKSENFKVKYKDNALRYSKEECQSIKEFLRSNSFKSVITLNMENMLKNPDFSIEDIDKEYEKNKTEAEISVKRRIGQDKLRKELLKKQYCCELCGIDVQEILIASHIKPWKYSNNIEKLDIDNVLLLCSMHDALFDKGFITFDKNGKIIISKYLNENMRALLNIHDESKIENISDKKREYLKLHHELYKENFDV